MRKMKNKFNPKIVGFLCNWCSDGIKPKQNIRIIKVMCSSRVDPQFVLKAFESGADGVLICGCHLFR
jgi:F420-non-reducing hydrogenase iron-sulfur subunit